MWFSRRRRSTSVFRQVIRANSAGKAICARNFFRFSEAADKFHVRRCFFNAKVAKGERSVVGDFAFLLHSARQNVTRLHFWTTAACAGESAGVVGTGTMFGGGGADASGGGAHLPFEFFASAVRTARNLIAEDQKFELLVTLGTMVFVKRHG